MPLFTTPDGRFVVAWETAGEGDGNSVIYDRGAHLERPWPGEAVWDRFSYLRSIGEDPQPTLPIPQPPPNVPPPHSVAPKVLQLTNPLLDPNVLNRIYTYWPNAWVRGTVAYVFYGNADNYPGFLSVDMVTGEVTHLEAWSKAFPYRGETECLYWDREGRICFPQGPRLMRVSPFTMESEILVDISQTHPGCDLWQAHSSEDGRVHSATVRRIVNDGRYPSVGTLLVRNGEQHYFAPTRGEIDESEVSPNSRWLLIKEGTDNATDNRIIEVETLEERLILEADGAVGHSAFDGDWLIGEDNIHGACVAWDLNSVLFPQARREVFRTDNMGHLSIRNGRWILTTPDAIIWVRWSVAAGATMTHLEDHGMKVLDPNRQYDFQVFANVDLTGSVVIFVSNRGIGRNDVFLLVLP
jgi:hypothetical protein